MTRGEPGTLTKQPRGINLNKKTVAPVIEGQPTKSGAQSERATKINSTLPKSLKLLNKKQVVAPFNFAMKASNCEQSKNTIAASPSLRDL